MRKVIWIAVITGLVGLSSVARAASEDEFKAALAKAEAVDKQAKSLKNQWTTTEDELKKAKAAAAAGKFDEAVKLAEHAEALAQASVAQAKEQEKLWPEAVIR